MSTAPAVAIAPPPRCFDRGRDRCGPVCGELATHLRRGRDWFSAEYFCDKHALPTDEPIPAEHAFRRVNVWGEIYLAGVAYNAPMSHTEAVARLEAAVRAAGGVLEVHQVRSCLVRTVAQPSQGLEFVGRIDRE